MRVSSVCRRAEIHDDRSCAVGTGFALWRGEVARGYGAALRARQSQDAATSNCRWAAVRSVG
jgi:hypothetical protein